jgi:hypothetical protein
MDEVDGQLDVITHGLFNGWIVNANLQMILDFYGFSSQDIIDCAEENNYDDEEYLTKIFEIWLRKE